ncbi:MAG TPA: ethylbenzene dehydrogenase-related protein, partial [Candidatus Methylomirabilis sp.]|nr:ethylbenzene dehydrogenase-related protein [Candidatus Methylomirabilis sp.]
GRRAPVHRRGVARRLGAHPGARSEGRARSNWIRAKVATTTIVLVVAVMIPVACQKAPPPSTAEVVVASRPNLPTDPNDAVWNDAPVHVEPLIPQDLVEPRLLKPSTAEVRVRAITDGTRVALRLEWADAAKEDLPGPARFSDACAIQFPVKTESSVPAPQMGEKGKPVEITFWRASWQAVVDGRGDTIKDIYPGASVDHYPFQAPSLEKGSQAQREMEARYSPARALGNRMAGPRERPVEDLIAEGPGTLTSAPPAGSEGRGRRTENGWSVLISRRLPEGLAPGKRSQVAIAIWAGAQQEAGSRKMRTGWIPIAVEAKP